MRNSKRQSGFALLEGILIIVILAAVVATGWWIYQRQHKASTAGAGPTSATSATASQSPVANDVSSAPTKINSTSDLNNALNTLNQNDPSSANTSDSTQLSTQSSSF